MEERTVALDTIHTLRAFVHRTLCDQENLLDDQFRLRECGLVVRGRACGMQFQLRGPRSIRLAAIWTADQNVIYFYDARGERFLKVGNETPFPFDPEVLEAELETVPA